MTIQPPIPNFPSPYPKIKEDSITTNKISANDLRIHNGLPAPESPKSNLVILAVAALLVGFILVFIAGFVAAIPFYACGFATILSSIVLAVLSLRE